GRLQVLDLSRLIHLREDRSDLFEELVFERTVRVGFGLETLDLLSNLVGDGRLIGLQPLGLLGAKFGKLLLEGLNVWVNVRLFALRLARELSKVNVVRLGEPLQGLHRV